MNDALRPEATAANRKNCVAQAVFIVSFRKIAASAESAGSEGEIMQAFPISDISGVEPEVPQRLLAYVSDDVFF